MCHYLKDNTVEKYEVLKFFESVIFPQIDLIASNTTLLNFLLSILAKYDLDYKYFEVLLKIEVPLDAARINIMLFYYSNHGQHYEAYKYLINVDDNVSGYKL